MRRREFIAGVGAATCGGWEMKQTAFESVSTFFVGLAAILSLFAPRRWIAILIGLACGLIVGPWVMFVYPGGMPFRALGDARVWTAMVASSLLPVGGGILGAVMAYGLKRAVGLLWRASVRLVTKKEPAGQPDVKHKTP
jgi:hypothetical protein